MGEQDPAKLRMDAVGTDQNIAFRGELFTRRGTKARFDLAIKGAIDMNATGR